MRFHCGIFHILRRLRAIWRDEQHSNEVFMIGRLALVVSTALAATPLTSADALAQDVHGIEICTVEKTMERRTSCLQSNVDFLQKTIARLAAEHPPTLEAANRQVENLKRSTASMQQSV